MNQEQIKQEFSKVTGINEAKITFKRLAKILHPDVGGSNEEFKILNKKYDRLQCF